MERRVSQAWLSEDGQTQPFDLKEFLGPGPVVWTHTRSSLQVGTFKMFPESLPYNLVDRFIRWGLGY